jgi:hypothetical protein
MLLILAALVWLAWLLYTDSWNDEGFEANDPSLRQMIIDKSR